VNGKYKLLDALALFVKGGEYTRFELAKALGAHPASAGFYLRQLHGTKAIRRAGYRPPLSTGGRREAYFVIGPGEDCPPLKANPAERQAAKERDLKQKRERYALYRDEIIARRKALKADKNAGKIATRLSKASPFLYGTPQGERNEG
jgi:hypothetical protein